MIRGVGSHLYNSPSDGGRILLPPRHAALPNGGIRLYLPKPVTGVVRRADKRAAHSYRGYWSRTYGNIKIHQAVCEAFHGPKPFPAAVVIHKDEDAHNNRSDNLKWGTQKENMAAPGYRAYCKERRGEQSPRAKWAANRNSGESEVA